MRLSLSGSIEGKVFALHITILVSILDNPYCYPELLGVIPEWSGMNNP